MNKVHVIGVRDIIEKRPNGIRRIIFEDDDPFNLELRKLFACTNLLSSVLHRVSFLRRLILSSSGQVKILLVLRSIFVQTREFLNFH